MIRFSRSHSGISIFLTMTDPSMIPGEIADCFPDPDSRASITEISQVWQLLMSADTPLEIRQLVPVVSWILNQTTNRLTIPQLLALMPFQQYLQQAGHQICLDRIEHDQIDDDGNYLTEAPNAMIVLEQAITEDNLPLVKRTFAHLVNLDQGDNRGLSNRVMSLVINKGAIDYVLAALPLFGYRSSDMVWYGMSLPIIDGLHRMHLIDAHMWDALLSNYIEGRPIEAIRELWEIRLAHHGGQPGPADRTAWFTALRTNWENANLAMCDLPWIQDLLAIEPSAIIEHRDELFAVLFVQCRYARAENTQVFTELVSWFLQTYGVDPLSNDGQFLVDCHHPLFYRAMDEYMAENICYHHDAQVYYYRHPISKTLVVACKEPLPLDGWYVVRIEPLWYYTRRDEFGVCNIAQRMTDPSAELVAVYLRPHTDDQATMIHIPRILSDLRDAIGPMSAAKSARSA